MRERGSWNTACFGLASEVIVAGELGVREIGGLFPEEPEVGAVNAAATTRAAPDTIAAFTGPAASSRTICLFSRGGAGPVLAGPGVRHNETLREQRGPECDQRQTRAGDDEEDHASREQEDPNGFRNAIRAGPPDSFRASYSFWKRLPGRPFLKIRQCFLSSASIPFVNARSGPGFGLPIHLTASPLRHMDVRALGGRRCPTTRRST
jgi:hypothetical protein